MKSSFLPEKAAGWSPAIVYTLFLFSLSLLAIPTGQFLQRTGVYPLFFWSLWGGFISGGIFFARTMRTRLTFKRTAFLTAIAGLYGCLFKLSAYDSEKLHLVTYSLAAVIYSRRLSQKGTVPLIVAVAVLDEALQHFVPGRFFQLYDIFLNISAGILALSLKRVLSP